jgi:hypothetical protein
MEKQLCFAGKKMVFSMVMFVVFIATFTLSSCKKSDTPDPTPPKEDLSVTLTAKQWNVSGAEFKVGSTWKSQPITIELERYFQFIDITFKQGGTLTLTNQGMSNTQVFDGTWKLTDKTLEVTSHTHTQSYAVETLDKTSLVVNFPTDDLNDPDGGGAVSALRLRYTH